MDPAPLNHEGGYQSLLFSFSDPWNNKNERREAKTRTIHHCLDCRNVTMNVELCGGCIGELAKEGRVMPKFRVEVTRVQYVEIEIEARDLEDARRLVERRDHPLPPDKEWHTFKDAWEYRAPLNDDGEYDPSGDNWHWEKI